MKIIRLYTGPDHQSHFDWIEIPCDQQDTMGQVSRWISTQACFIRESSSDLITDWHSVSRRQLVVILAGSIEIEVGSGEKQIFRTGDLFFAEDTTGQGHVTRALGDHPVRGLFLPLAADELVQNSVIET